MTAFTPIYVVTVKQGGVDPDDRKFDFTQTQVVTTFKDVQDALAFIQRLNGLTRELFQFFQLHCEIENNYNPDTLPEANPEDMRKDYEKGVLDFFEKFSQVHPRSLIFKAQYVEDMPEYECKVVVDELEPVD